MGSKNGKYDMQAGSLNDGDFLPSWSSDIDSTGRKQEATNLPTCVHREVLIDTLPPNLDQMSLVWLDTEIYNRASNIDIEVKLKNLIGYVRLFDRVDHCERYIKQIGKFNQNPLMRQERLLVIISTALAPTIIPHLHELSQVKSIYIFGKAKTLAKGHQQWLRKYNKVKGLYTSSRSLLTQIAQDQNEE